MKKKLFLKIQKGLLQEDNGLLVLLNEEGLR